MRGLASVLGFGDLHDMLVLRRHMVAVLLLLLLLHHQLVLPLLALLLRVGVDVVVHYAVTRPEQIFVVLMVSAMMIVVLSNRVVALSVLGLRVALALVSLAGRRLVVRGQDERFARHRIAGFCCSTISSGDQSLSGDTLTW